MSSSPISDGDSTRSIHRARPSVVSNVSALAESTLTYGSVMSADGLARLSQFPPVPVGVPITPIQNAMVGPSSPVGSDRTMAPPTSPRPLPVPPTLLPPAPLNVQKRVLPTSPSQPPDSQLVSSSSPPQSAKSSYPSPHDWHDGSSSIASDPYGETVLSTSFITSLLSSVAPGENASGPSSYKRPRYESSVVSTAPTVDSTITYPPPKAGATQPPPVPPMPTSFKYPPHPPPYAPSTSETGSLSSTMTPQTLQPPGRHFTSIEGRFSPETWASDESSSAMGQSVAAGPASASRVLTATPSIQSMTSSTPLMNAVQKGPPIYEEDEPRTAGSSGPSAHFTHSSRERRSSVATTKTTRSYVSSLITRLSHSTGERRSMRAFFRGKPLPPVPPLPDHAFQEIHIRKQEEQLPLPALMNRAATLSHLLDKGHRPYDSAVFEHNKDEVSDIPAAGPSGYGDVRYSGANPNMVHSARGRRGRSGDYTQAWFDPSSIPAPGTPTKSKPFTKKRKTIASVVIVLLIAIIAIGVGVGVSIGRRKTSRHSCLGNLAGAACNLNATCVCAVPSGGGQCTNLAQSVVDLVPDVNRLFNVNFTTASVATSLWQAQVLPSGPNCADQAEVIDVAPALDGSSAPNRTRWAQAALLWNLASSEDTSATADLQSFIQRAPWRSLSAPDGPVSDGGSAFRTVAAGFQFDFATQSVLAQSRSFESDGQPSAEQAGRVNAVAQKALDRMYSFALASSTQQLTALENHWTSTLSQPKSSLSTFLSLLRRGPVLLPFDAVASPGGHSITSLLSNVSDVPFPPPLSCYPGLSSAQTQIVQQLETSVFGLSAPSSPTAFDIACYPDRPTYGVLDFLQLRTPFIDGRTGVAKQAAVLAADAMPRVIVYSGEVVSAFPGVGYSDAFSTDPRRYGTLAKDSLNHVLLEYLRSIDVNVAKELIQYVLGSPGPIAPPTSQTLLDALPTLPLLEVAVFGTIDPTDIPLTVSSLADPSGNLFFGSDASRSVRDWALSPIHGSSPSLIWSENATSPWSCQDTLPSTPTFDFIFSNASAAIRQHDKTGTPQYIDQVFQNVGLNGSFPIFPQQ